jgi:chemotaxis family two-component system response regulator PixG
MHSASIGYANAASTLASLTQQRVTGELTLTSGSQRWKLYFFHGRLLFSTGNIHRVRRWNRAVKLHCPQLPPTQVLPGEPWEYQILSHSVSQNHLSVKQAQAIIRTCLEEVLFAWLSNPTLTSRWHPIQRFSLSDNSALSLLLSAPQVEKVLQQALDLWKQWKALELVAVSPYQSPLLRPSNKATPHDLHPLPDNLTLLLTGRYTLWDIAAYVHRPVPTLTRFLLPWVQQGLVSLEEVPDLPLPQKKEEAAVTEELTTYKPLIACIDDSPTVGKVLASILEPAGYRVLTIREALAGIATLIKHKPDLILMDLIMPDTSGYNLCQFLRKTPAFSQTPIIILTSQDGLLDRTRAKMVGASDFLSKPTNPQVMLSVIQNHLSAILERHSTNEVQTAIAN